MTWVGIALFGALGAVARFRLDTAVSAAMPTRFPLGTLIVNLTGALALGLLTGAGLPHRLTLVLGTGFMGGYTTFSTWMVESVRLGEDGDIEPLLRNLWLSLVVGCASAAAGFYAGQAII